MGIQFTIGLMLVLGLASTVLYGIKKSIFFIDSNSNFEYEKIDLIQQAEPYSVSPGLVEIVGYPSRELYDTHIDYSSDLLASVTYSYIAVTPKPQEKIHPDSPLLIVRRADVLTSYDTKETNPLDPNTPISIKGILGYHADSNIPDTIKDQFIDKLGHKNSTILTITEDTQIPAKATFLIWFIPVLLSFGIGLFLVLRWLYALKIQFLSPQPKNTSK
jgi:hypothetical protein